MSAIEDARAALTRYDRSGVREVLATLPAVVNSLRALIADHESLVSEMHQRELHHFEVEQAAESVIGMVEQWDWVPERADVIGTLRTALGDGARA